MFVQIKMITDREQAWSDTYPDSYPQWFFQDDFYDTYGPQGFYNRTEDKSYKLSSTISTKNFAIINADPMFVTMSIYQTNEQNVDLATKHENFQNPQSESYLKLLKEKPFQITVVIKTDDHKKKGVIGINFYATRPYNAEAYTLFMTCPWYGLRFIPGGLDAPRDFSKTEIDDE